MAAELQPLIDRIQKEAVDQARQQADDILAQARKKAAAIVREAEEKARQALEKADKDAEAYTRRSTRTLEQAARDVLIAVAQGVDNIVSNLVTEELDKSLDRDLLKQIITRMAEAYAREGGQADGLEVLVSPADQEALTAFFKKEYAGKLAGGVKVSADHDILKGFQISFDGGKVYHDFTREAIADALSKFLRPQLADIVRGAAKSGDAKGEAATS